MCTAFTYRGPVENLSPSGVGTAVSAATTPSSSSGKSKIVSQCTCSSVLYSTM